MGTEPLSFFQARIIFQLIPLCSHSVIFATFPLPPKLPMRTSLNILLGRNVRFAHRTQRPLPDPHDLIHQQVLGAKLHGRNQRGQLRNMSFHIAVPDSEPECISCAPLTALNVPCPIRTTSSTSKFLGIALRLLNKLRQCSNPALTFIAQHGDRAPFFPMLCNKEEEVGGGSSGTALSPDINSQSNK